MLIVYSNLIEFLSISNFVMDHPSYCCNTLRLSIEGCLFSLFNIADCIRRKSEQFGYRKQCPKVQVSRASGFFTYFVSVCGEWVYRVDQVNKSHTREINFDDANICVPHTFFLPFLSASTCDKDAYAHKFHMLAFENKIIEDRLQVKF